MRVGGAWCVTSKKVTKPNMVNIFPQTETPSALTPEFFSLLWVLETLSGTILRMMAYLKICFLKLEIVWARLCLMRRTNLNIHEVFTLVQSGSSSMRPPDAVAFVLNNK